MPTIIDAASSAKNPIIIQAVTDNLQQYAAQALGNEAPIVAPNAGYKAYNKRMAFAKLATLNPEQYGSDAAVFIEQITNGLIIEARNNNVPEYNYILEQNPSGKSLMEADATQRANISHVGQTSGRSVFDVLAGVTQADLI